jgi:Ser/Thr protein kinase RdoA (MazF antagonist)
VTQQLGETVLILAARCFSARLDDCRRIYGGHFNQVFAFSRMGKEYILRLTPPNTEINQTTLLAGLDFMEHLARHGVDVPAPLRSNDNHLITTIDTPEGTYLATAFERATGVLAEELPFEIWDDERIHALGMTVGRFHACSQDYQPPPGLERPAWDQVTNCFNPAEEIHDALLRSRRVEARLGVQALPRDTDGYGWIHTDLHGANFMLEPETNHITLLDFDDFARGWYIMDIAMLLHDFCVLAPDRPVEPFAQRFLTAFLRGYLPQHPLAPEWIERLPLFLKLLETGLYAQVMPLYSPAAPTASADAEPNDWVGRFMVGRAERIAGEIPVVSLDFTAIARAAGV